VTRSQGLYGMHRALAGVDGRGNPVPEGWPSAELANGTYQGLGLEPPPGGEALAGGEQDAAIDRREAPVGSDGKPAGGLPC